MSPFAACPATPAVHLRLAMLGALAQLMERADDANALLQDHPFVGDYLAEMRAVAGDALASADAWRDAVAEWAEEHAELPLRRLGSAGCDHLALALLATIAVAEEDARVATLFRGGLEGSLSAAMLAALWQRDDQSAVPEALAHLLDVGLIQEAGGLASWRSSRVALAAGVWEALNGHPCLTGQSALVGLGQLLDWHAVILPRPDTPPVAALAEALRRQPCQLLRIAGPQHNGRRSLAGAVAKALGRPLLVLPAAVLGDIAAFRTLTVIAWIRDAIPLVELGLEAGVERLIPAPAVAQMPMFVVTGDCGGVAVADNRTVTSIRLPIPDPAARQRLWRRMSRDLGDATAEALAREFRVTSGAIARAARDGAARAVLSGRKDVSRADVVAALSDAQDPRLETVARRVPAAAHDFLVLDELASEDFAALALRCRHREALAVPGEAGGAGIRALFVGPSGAGKTLAARRLAADLGKVLFRIDLAAAISKYIGETEKNLDRAFAAAEDRDCILLLDEGDALMTRRTDVGNANDRYANLETNFLLQRIESFEGILLVTTNAGDRIDKAFGRRMDVVIQFRAPDEVARYQILARELGDHRASDALVQEVACRCALSGGQLRNMARHAKLLALEDGLPVGKVELIAAVRREYRKAGGHCPLKSQLAVAV
jgi:hypothetical protein